MASASEENVFTLHLHCSNCMRPSTKVIRVPRMEGAPSTEGEFLEMLEAQPIPFHCTHCESKIGHLIGLTMERKDVAA